MSNVVCLYIHIFNCVILTASVKILPNIILTVLPCGNSLIRHLPFSFFLLINAFNKKARQHYITSFLCNAIQICVGQKDQENQCRANVFKVFLSTVILHQIITTRYK